MINTQPFFILSNPRSGSSLLRIICESHPNITVPPESGFLEWWYDKYKDWNIDDSLNNEKIDAFCHDLISSKKFETWDFNIVTLKTKITLHKPKNYQELIALIYIVFGESNNKQVMKWGDKNNYYIHKTELLKTLYPNAKYIYLVRDGRDVATSYIALKKLKSKSQYVPKLVSNIMEIAKEWEDNNQKLISFFNSIADKNVLIIRYEDLVKNTEDVCEQIVDFLDVTFHKTMLDYYKINKTKKIEPKETLDWKKKTLEKPDASNIGKYKNILSKEEINTFNKIARNSLTVFDYEF